MMRITDTVKHIIILNVIFWIGTIVIGQYGDVFTDLFAMHFPMNDSFKPWQIFTHMFMHASYVGMNGGASIFIFHILFNMLGVWMFGSPLEQMWGRNKFLIFYFSCGLGATILPLAIDYYNFYTITSSLIDSGKYTMDSITGILNEGKFYVEWNTIVGEEKVSTLNSLFNGPSLGASGALMGLLVAFGMSFPNSSLMLIFLPIPIKAKYFIPLLLGYEIISGFTGGSSMFGFNIGHWAHVGGALTGFLIFSYWKKTQFNKNRWDR
ncbi:rhomboid family intramembrane serine protease [uncultured Psychroserpens sp.]|uniref:rhomboid family intramembrane serine protease n=1 Tax=uncultured Psychroserpens sp. TaxID=255436 RepID=UPI00263635F1|nr:rhomboid family intramembrane serine protease [uncultured Psychroserpens sp.]